MDICQKILVFILFNSFNFRVFTCLRINRFEVPPAVAKGQSVTLHCNFDLEGDDLYSVKYYKDYVEFYRYLPNDDPRPAQKFKLKGAYVDISRSNATHAFLTHTDLSSDGMYACEVSTEGPSFSTIRSERLMKVYALPQENLKIEGRELQYDVNDKINLSCKSGDGRPLPDLFWFINDNMASFDQLIFYPPQTNADGLQSTKLGLVFLATRNYFHRGELKLRCTATLTLVYEFEAVEYLIGGTAKNKSQTTPYSWSKDWSLQPDRETPIIRGGKQKYHVNDVLNMNCTSSAHDAQLKWFINDDEANSSQLIRYNSEDMGSIVVGLRFVMAQHHFQMQEIKLRCVAIFRRTIADFHEPFSIRTANLEALEAQSPNEHNKSSSPQNARYRGLYSISATVVIVSMQSILFGEW